MMKIKINKYNLKSKIFIIFLFFVYFNIYNSYGYEIKLPNFGFICEDTKKTNSKFEFIFSRNDNDTEDIVFRRIEGKFQYMGEVLAKKSGSYVIWEDKVFFRTSDFAWMMDKVTSKVTPLILSIGNKLESFDKIPNKMTCNSRSIYY